MESAKLLFWRIAASVLFLAVVVLGALLYLSRTGETVVRLEAPEETPEAPPAEESPEAPAADVPEAPEEVSVEEVLEEVLTEGSSEEPAE